LDLLQAVSWSCPCRHTLELSMSRGVSQASKTQVGRGARGVDIEMSRAVSREACAVRKCQGSRGVWRGVSSLACLRCVSPGTCRTSLVRVCVCVCVCVCQPWHLSHQSATSLTLLPLTLLPLNLYPHTRLHTHSLTKTHTHTHMRQEERRHKTRRSSLVRQAR